jgi:predicted patatin/cPLA2 family phospholipase
MPSKQQEYYNKLTVETTDKVATYKDFQRQIENIKADSARRIKSFQNDMKLISKQIELNNKQLKDNGQPIVEFVG